MWQYGIRWRQSLLIYEVLIKLLLIRLLKDNYRFSEIYKVNTESSQLPFTQFLLTLTCM